MFSKMIRPSCTAPGRWWQRLSSARTISDACLATSVLVRPMAVPMSAFFRAGASFTRPRSWRQSPVAFKGLQDLDLMGGCDPGKDNNLSYSPRQFLFTQLVHLFAGYYLIFFMSVGKQSQIGRNRPGGIPVVAGDHLNFNPRLPAKLDGGTGFRPRRVDHPQKAEGKSGHFPRPPPPSASPSRKGRKANPDAQGPIGRFPVEAGKFLGDRRRQFFYAVFPQIAAAFFSSTSGAPLVGRPKGLPPGVPVRGMAVFPGGWCSSFSVLNQRGIP